MSMNSQWYWMNWLRIVLCLFSSFGMCAVDWGKIFGTIGYVINITLTYFVGAMYLGMVIYGLVDYNVCKKYKKKKFKKFKKSYAWLLNLTLLIGYIFLILAYILYQVIHSYVHTPYILIGMGTTSILVCCVLNQYIKESKK
jgi:hypothetical protein